MYDRRTSRAALAAAIALAAATAGAQTELRISHQAVARGIAATLMTPGGRWFLQGSSADECSHAFVQDPRVDAVGDRLRITVLFSGRGAVAVGERCVGPGDTFDVSLTGVPVHRDGEIVLDDARLEAPDRRYFEVVSGLLDRAFRDRFRYPVRNAAEWAVHDLRERTGRHVVLDAFDVGPIGVDADGLRLPLRLSLAVD